MLFKFSFVGNSEKERVKYLRIKALPSLWTYLHLSDNFYQYLNHLYCPPLQNSPSTIFSPSPIYIDREISAKSLQLWQNYYLRASPHRDMESQNYEASIKELTEYIQFLSSQLHPIESNSNVKSIPKIQQQENKKNSFFKMIQAKFAKDTESEKEEQTEQNSNQVSQAIPLPAPAANRKHLKSVGTKPQPIRSYASPKVNFTRPISSLSKESMIERGLSPTGQPISPRNYAPIKTSENQDIFFSPNSSVDDDIPQVNSTVSKSNEESTTEENEEDLYYSDSIEEGGLIEGEPSHFKEPPPKVTLHCTEQSMTSMILEDYKKNE